MFLANNTQKLAAKILEVHIAQKRVAHAYIFSGREDASMIAELAAERTSTDIKEEFAVAFASALLSGDNKLFGAIDTPLSRRIWQRLHPDVRWLGADKTERSIKIESIREIIHWASLRPYEAAWKVCIVPRAERLTEESANAFLKTLEEPPRHTVFILLVENKTHLLETIQSRSFEIRLTPVILPTAAIHHEMLDSMPIREIFETYPGLPREEVKSKLDGLMLLAREKLYRVATEKDPETDMVRWLEALDLVYDAKSALEANANQKLMATRLAMRLMNLFPSKKVMI